MQTTTQGSAAPKRCKGIITHWFFHNDEGVGVLELKMFGEKKYPGIADAPILFWEAGSSTPDGRTAEEWEADGYVLVGVGNGKYDEHSARYKGKKTCAAILIAEDLGISDAPYLQELLDFTLRRDTTGKGTFMELPHFLNLAHKEWAKTDPQGVMDWYLQSLRLYLKNEFRLHNNTKKEFEKHSETFICRYYGKDITVTSIVSDDQNMFRFARSRFGSKANVFIQKKSTGHVQIHTKSNTFIDLDTVIKLLRIEEKKLSGISKMFDDSELKSPGTLSSIPQWHYDRDARRIFNGTTSAPSVIVTKISFVRIIELVRSGLQRDFRSGNGMQVTKKQHAGNFHR